MNPAYPGGFEILAAGRPDIVVLQHAPARKEYDGFPGYPIQPLKQQIQAIEIISGKRVIAVTVNHENIPRFQITKRCSAITGETDLPAFDVLEHGADRLVAEVVKHLESHPATEVTQGTVDEQHPSSSPSKPEEDFSH
jgi:uncharacterized NAD-dependent epimerase/dehydratase family protein